MKTLVYYLFLLLIAASITNSQSLAPAQSIFMQGNNINTVFRTDGIINYDWETFISKEAGFIWPVNSNIRRTAVYTSGIWVGAKVGPQRELRFSASAYGTQYSPGNIPVIGQVPPSSVCNDPSWRGYHVQLTDPSLTNGGFRTKMAGGRLYSFTYDSWASWPVEKGAPYVEVNGIPGYQPAWNGDRPGIGNGMTARPDELLFMVYMDYTNCTNNVHQSEISLPGGTLPIGVEIHQLSFMFNCPPLQNTYFVKWKIINKSQYNWDSTYFSFYNDIDIGAGVCGAHDDAVGCDTTREMVFGYNGDNEDCNYGTNPPAIGNRYIQTPLRFTGNNNDTAKLPYDTIAGYLMTGLSGYYYQEKSPPDPCLNDPDNAIAGYNIMKGKDACGHDIINPFSGQPTRFRYDGDACSRIGWFDSLKYERRDDAIFGPISMNSADTQIIVMGGSITRDGGNNFQNVCALQSLSDSVLYHYYHDFQSCVPIGIEPIGTEIPTKFDLFQNYPNPFNPVTKIKFDIPLSRGVSEGRGVLLKIYDILGKEISSLVNEELKPGTYEIEWNAENIPSGVYFYSLITNDFTQTKRMVVLK
jgi:hypothetical protein